MFILIFTNFRLVSEQTISSSTRDAVLSWRFLPFWINFSSRWALLLFLEVLVASYHIMNNTYLKFHIQVDIHNLGFLAVNTVIALMSPLGGTTLYPIWKCSLSYVSIRTGPYLNNQTNDCSGRWIRLLSRLYCSDGLYTLLGCIQVLARYCLIFKRLRVHRFHPVLQGPLYHNPWPKG